MTEAHREAFDFLCGITPERVPRWKFWRQPEDQSFAIRQACACLEEARPEDVLARLFVRYWHSDGELHSSLAPLVHQLAGKLPPHGWPSVR